MGSLSAKEELIAEAVERVKEECTQLKSELAETRYQILEAQHSDPDTAFIILTLHQFDKTDLSGKIHMRCTTGTHVISRYRHDTHLSVNLYLTAEEGHRRIISRKKKA